MPKLKRSKRCRVELVQSHPFGIARARPRWDGVSATTFGLGQRHTLTKDLDRLRQRDDIMGTFVSPSGRAVALTLGIGMD